MGRGLVILFEVDERIVFNSRDTFSTSNFVVVELFESVV